MEDKKTQNNTTKKIKTFEGVVISNSMKDTVVVEVGRYVKHPKYGKFINYTKKIKAHDAGNTKNVGDKVTVTSVKPISKTKNFIVS